MVFSEEETQDEEVEEELEKFDKMGEKWLKGLFILVGHTT